jgi:hypothetical protein
MDAKVHYQGLMDPGWRQWPAKVDGLENFVDGGPGFSGSRVPKSPLPAAAPLSSQMVKIGPLSPWFWFRFENFRQHLVPCHLTGWQRHRSSVRARAALCILVSQELSMDASCVGALKVVIGDFRHPNSRIYPLRPSRVDSPSVETSVI